MDCVTDNELVELLENRLSADRRATVLAALEDCSECRAIAKDWAITSQRAFSSAEGTPRPEIPTVVAGYVLEELIGVGGMGLVFRARDPELRREVAIKIAASAEPGSVLEEGRMLATVRHDHVIAVHGVGSAEGLAYLVMELVDGKSLDRAGAVGWREATRWFRGVASGLAAVHAAGVVHRDVKPSNLLLDRGRVRLADFGLASSRGGAPAGTLAYLAPEVADGAVATAASDQFSFFAALYSVIAARRPFAGQTLVEQRAAWRVGITEWPNIPTRLRRVIERGLAIAPADRWPDMLAVEGALARVTRTRRWPWLAIGASGALAAVVLAWGTDAPACEVPDPGWAARADAPLAALAADYEQRWREASTRACDAPLVTRGCLGRARERVDSLFDALGSRPDARAIADGIRAIAELPPPDRCFALGDGAPEVVPPAYHRAEALHALGRDREARTALPDPASDTAATALLRGRIERDFQNLVVAEAALRRAVELASRDQLTGVLADAQLDLAVVVGVLQDRHEAGVAYADAALSVAERISDPRRTAQARLAIGLIASASGQHAAAIPMLVDAAAQLELHGAGPLEIATAELRVGWALNAARRGGEAKAHLERALVLRRARLGEAHPLVGFVEVELGMAEHSAGKFAEATRRLRGVIERLGAHPPAASAAWSALGTVQVDTGDYAGAEASFAKTLALRTAMYGELHLDVARTRVNLASTRYYQGKYEPALETYRSAEATARSLLGGRHPEVAQIQAGIAMTLQSLERLDEAATAIAGAIAIYRALPGHDALLSDALLTHGIIELAAERLPTARASLEDSLAILRRVHGDEHVALAPNLASLGELYLAMNRLDDAERVLLRSRALRTRHAVAPQRIAENDFVLAYVADKRGKRAEAIRLARSARALLGTDRPDLQRMIDDWLRTHR